MAYEGSDEIPKLLIARPRQEAVPTWFAAELAKDRSPKSRRLEAENDLVEIHKFFTYLLPKRLI